MRVVQLSTYDVYGGAGLAATRLHRALRGLGVDSQMLVRQQRSRETGISQPGAPWLHLWLKVQRRLDQLPLAAVRRPTQNFSIGWTPGPVISAVRQSAASVVHAHWVADGFVRLEELASIPVPVVWTLHDMWAFTGGCHYPGACVRYKSQCGRCPELGGERDRDYSRSGWLRRRGMLDRRRVTFVAPSRWMAERARESALLGGADVRVIPNGLDVAVYAPVDRVEARAALGLPRDKTILLAGAAQLRANPRKGFSALCAAMDALRERGSGDAVELAVFGDPGSVLPNIAGVRVRSLGVLRGDAELVRAYAAADIFVLPSLEDNLPNTAIEAMAVGTPVVAYGVGGVTEIIDDGINGLLARGGDTFSLATALGRLIGDPVLRVALGRAAREKVLRVFAAADSAAAHRRLYEELQQPR